LDSQASLGLRTTDNGYSIQRKKLDPMPRELAGLTPGVDLLLGCRARNLISENGRITGVGIEDTEGRTSQIRAKLAARVNLSRSGRPPSPRWDCSGG
jgi:hypothetical protein